MPTYEYRCDACGHAFEHFQSMSSDPIRKCPKCKKNKVKRLIGTGAGLIFKGSGFYITDYRDQAYADKAKADSGAAPAATSGESKPDSAGSKPDSPESKPAAATTTEAKPATVAKPASSSSPKKKKGK